MSYKEFKAGIMQMAAWQAEMNKTCETHGKRYEIPLEGRNIEIVVYLKRPDAPVVFCGFGGGFVFGGCALDDMLWNTIHEKLDVTLVSIGYRRAPEFKFPCGLNDMYDAIAYVEDNKAEFGIASDDYSVYGNSAGANLATNVCMLDTKRGGKLKIQRQILNYPYCDLYTIPKEKGQTGNQRYMYQIFIDDYCKQEELNNPLVSPVFAKEEDLANMPRAIISLAENDPLLPEGARYINKLRGAGVNVVSHIASKMQHGYSETFFQGENEYLAEDEIKAIRDGSMEREVYKTIDFIKENW